MHRYEEDFYGWTQEQAALLSAGKADALDTANLVEEILSLGNSERNALEGHLESLFMHLLKRLYQPTHQGRSCELTIMEQRRKINRRLARSPSLRAALPELIADAYGDAILSAAKDTGLDTSAFPVECPWGFEQAMQDN